MYSTSRITLASMHIIIIICYRTSKIRFMYSTTRTYSMHTSTPCRYELEPNALYQVLMCLTSSYG